MIMENKELNTGDVKPKRIRRVRPMPTTIEDLTKELEIARKSIKKLEAMKDSNGVTLARCVKNVLNERHYLVLGLVLMRESDLAVWFAGYNGCLRRLLNVLQYISYVPYRTMSFVCERIHAYRSLGRRSVDYLVSVGYICIVKKPRLVMCTGGYKIEKVYVVTPLGNRVLLEIYEKAGVIE